MSSIRTAFRDFQKCLCWPDTADQEISCGSTGVRSQQVIFHMRNDFQPPALSKQEGIERMELHVTLIKFDFGWGKPQWAVIRADVGKAPVSSRDGTFRGRATAHRIAEAPGSLHLPVPLQGLSSSVRIISPCCLITRSFWLLTHAHAGGSLSEPSISPNSLLWVVPCKTHPKHSQSRQSSFYTRANKHPVKKLHINTAHTKSSYNWEVVK